MSRSRLTFSVKLEEAVMAKAKERLRGATGRVAAHRVQVGIPEDEGGEAKRDYKNRLGGMSLAQVAALHEFHERPWLRSWFDANMPRFKREMVEAMRAETNGDADAVRALAARWAGELRDWITLEHGGLKMLSAAAVDRKIAAGLNYPDVPLLATGQLVDAIRADIDGAPAA